MESESPKESRPSPAFAIASYAFLIGGLFLWFPATLACWFAGGIAGSMGVSARSYPFISGLGVVLNAILFAVGFVALRSGVSH
jgi:hypothetical protein